MSIDDVRSAIRIVGGALTVTRKTLSSDGIAWLLDTYVPGADLVVRPAAIRSAPGDDFVEVVGTVHLLGVDVPGAVLRFTAGDAGAELALTGQLPQSWRLSTLLPALAGSEINGEIDGEIDGVIAGRADITLRSRAAADHPRGLSLRAAYAPPPLWDLLAWFAAPDAKATIGGTLDFDGGLPQVSLAVAPVLRARLGGYLDVELEAQHALRSYLRKGSTQPRLAVSSRLAGSLAFKRGDGEVRVPIAAALDTGTGLLALQLDTQEVFDLGLSQLAGWLNGLDLGAASLPPSYAAPASLTLHDLRFVVGLRTRTLEYVALALRSTAPWNALDGVLSIDGVTIDVMVRRPASAPDVILTLGGVLHLGGVAIAVHAALPEFQLQGQLAPDSAVDLAPLVEHHLGVGHGLPGGLQIAELGFSAVPSRGTYDLAIAAEGSWPIVSGVSLDGLGLAVRYERRDGTAAIEVDLSAFATLGGLGIHVTAHRSSGGERGWKFTGSTGPGQALPIGNLMQELASVFGVETSLPAAIADAVIENLQLAFDTDTGAFGFAGQTRATLDSGTQVELVVQIDVAPVGDRYHRTIRGTLHAAGRTFDVVFDQAADAARFVASYADPAAAPIQLGALLRALCSEGDLIALVDNIEIGVTSALLAWERPADGPSRLLFGADLGGGIDLSNLPLVGSALPASERLSLDFQPLLATRPFSQQEVAALRALVPAGGLALPDGALGRGLTMATRLRLGEVTLDLDLPVGVDPQSGAITDRSKDPAVPAPITPPGGTPASDGVSWLRVQKAFGPLHVERIGARFQGGELGFLLDASLVAAGLTLSLDGLSAAISLAQLRASSFAPQFALRGIGVDYRGGPVEIGGAFLRRTITTGELSYDVYDGAAILATDALTLEAMGSYARVAGHPSLFVYAVLDYPIGGPSFFFVTGLAAGFGYNRALRLPSLDQLPRFPLIEAATDTASSGSPDTGTGGMMAMLARLEQDGAIPPALGEAFLAVGIRFTSFKLIDSFLLLTAALGGQFALDLLGLSTLVVPTPEAGRSVTPLAEIQMALRGSFLPDQGFLGIAAQLTQASYILSRDCHLTGGFAFYSWFSGPHAGDFVQTLGGYHPQFQRPDWYPVVPRLGVNWQVDSHLSIKGEAYFALTSSLLMAGGALQVTWESGDLRAWFLLAADLLVSWKPFHYDARIAVDMGVSYTFQLFGSHTISVDIGADMHVWGPDFAGTAHVKLWIVSFDVSFGSSAPALPPPLPWDGGDHAFQDSFLPHDALCSVTLAGGLLRSVVERTGDVEQTIWIVNAKELCLVTNSVVPSKRARVDGVELAHDGNTRFGVAPMALASDAFQTTHEIRIYRDGAEAPQLLHAEPVRKRVPAALWGEQRQAGLHDAAFIEDALTGFTLTPAGGPVPGETAPVPRSALQFSTDEVQNGYAWTTPAGGFKPAPLDDDARRDALAASLGDSRTAEARASLLRALGFEPTAVTLRPDSAALFIIPPQIAA